MDEFKAAGLQKVTNVVLYLLLLDQDMAEFRYDRVHARDERRRRFVAKQEAVLLYEAAEDIPQLLGKEFRRAVEDLGTSPELIAKLNNAASSLHKFWGAHRDFLGSIRKALAAHREHDALLYLEKLDALDPTEVTSVAKEFMGHFQQLTEVLLELVELMADLQVILDDMARSSSASDLSQN